MGEDERVVITAIRDSQQEGFIAGALLRLGWNVIYRATSADGLVRAVRNSPNLVVIKSEDFSGVEEQLPTRTVTLAAASKKAQSGRFSFPATDFELQELLRLSGDEVQLHRPRIEKLSMEVTVVASVKSGIGASTLAMNIAHELANSGEEILLLDANQRSPFLSQYFQIPHINRSAVSTPFGFSVGEVNSIENLKQFTEMASLFGKVVLDIGELNSLNQILHGNRLEDICKTWALQSATRVLLLGRAGEKSLVGIAKAIRDLRESSLRINPVIGLMLQSAIGRRERNELIKRTILDSKIDVALFSRDFRAIEKAEISGLPLAFVSPKSVLRGEIRSQIIAPILERKVVGKARVH